LEEDFFCEDSPLSPVQKPKDPGKIKQKTKPLQLDTRSEWLLSIMSFYNR
jgi:hypothetical protein